MTSATFSMSIRSGHSWFPSQVAKKWTGGDQGNTIPPLCIAQVHHIPPREWDYCEKLDHRGLLVCGANDADFGTFHPVAEVSTFLPEKLDESIPAGP